MSSNQASGWAVGWALFAAIMMSIAGVFQLFAGIAGIAEDEIYGVTSEWVFAFDTTTWGWIHVVLGIVLLAGSWGIMRGNVAARSLGVVLAGLAAIANFAWLPYYPVWALVVIAACFTIIWALTVHGRDIASTVD